MTAFRSFPSRVLALAGLAAFLALSPAAWAEPTQYPLTIRNCGVDVTFAKAPQRAVAIGQSSTEILLSLGLADRIVGTAVWFGPVLQQYEAVNAKIPRLADNDPSSYAPRTTRSNAAIRTPPCPRRRRSACTPTASR
mgnify:CR=1 FL=1